jgi:hypothetical protein
MVVKSRNLIGICLTSGLKLRLHDDIDLIVAFRTKYSFRPLSSARSIRILRLGPNATLNDLKDQYELFEEFTLAVIRLAKKFLPAYIYRRVSERSLSLLSWSLDLSDVSDELKFN